MIVIVLKVFTIQSVIRLITYADTEEADRPTIPPSMNQSNSRPIIKSGISKTNWMCDSLQQIPHSPSVSRRSHQQIDDASGSAVRAMPLTLNTFDGN